MYAGRDSQERLSNGFTWLEYRSFPNNSFDVLFRDIPFGEDYEVDLGLVDFGNQNIKVKWFYSGDNMDQYQHKKEAEEEFSELLDEHFLSSREGWDYTSGLHSEARVSYSVMNSPPVRGDILRKEDTRNLDRLLQEFSDGIFDPPLSSFEYETMWVEGETAFD